MKEYCTDVALFGVAQGTAVGAAFGAFDARKQWRASVSMRGAFRDTPRRVLALRAAAAGARTAGAFAALFGTWKLFECAISKVQGERNVVSTAGGGALGGLAYAAAAGLRRPHQVAGSGAAVALLASGMLVAEAAMR